MKDHATGHPRWNRDEFITFLLLYAAHADMEVKDAELSVITEHIKSASVGEIFKEFQRLSDFERIQVIQAYRTQYFPDAQQKEALLQKIASVFWADGHINVMEHSVFLMLNKIL